VGGRVEWTRSPGTSRDPSDGCRRCLPPSGTGVTQPTVRQWPHTAAPFSRPSLPPRAQSCTWRGRRPTAQADRLGRTALHALWTVQTAAHGADRRIRSGARWAYSVHEPSYTLSRSRGTPARCSATSVTEACTPLPAGACTVGTRPVQPKR